VRDHGLALGGDAASALFGVERQACPERERGALRCAQIVHQHAAVPDPELGDGEIERRRTGVGFRWLRRRTHAIEVRAPVGAERQVKCGAVEREPPHDHATREQSERIQVELDGSHRARRAALEPAGLGQLELADREAHRRPQ
jgi:hypothetical protein